MYHQGMAHHGHRDHPDMAVVHMASMHKSCITLAAAVLGTVAEVNVRVVVVLHHVPSSDISGSVVVVTLSTVINSDQQHGDMVGW